MLEALQFHSACNVKQNDKAVYLNEIKRLKKKVNTILEINEELKSENRRLQQKEDPLFISQAEPLIKDMLHFLRALKHANQWMDSVYKTELTKDFFRIEKKELERILLGLNLKTPQKELFQCMSSLGVMKDVDGRFLFHVMAQKKQYTVYLIRKSAIDMIIEDVGEE